MLRHDHHFLTKKPSCQNPLCLKFEFCTCYADIPQLNHWILLHTYHTHVQTFKNVTCQCKPAYQQQSLHVAADETLLQLTPHQQEHLCSSEIQPETHFHNLTSVDFTMSHISLSSLSDTVTTTILIVWCNVHHSIIHSHNDLTTSAYFYVLHYITQFCFCFVSIFCTFVY